MTEHEEFFCEDPWLTLKSLSGRTSARKRGLFACACCRRVWPLLEKANRTAIKVAEQFSDGEASEQERDSAKMTGWEASRKFRTSPFGVEGLIAYSTAFAMSDAAPSYAAGAALCAAGIDCSSDVSQNYESIAAVCASGSTAYEAIRSGSVANKKSAWERVDQQERIAQSQLLRDIFGNLFRSRSVEECWITPSVRSIAHFIYKGRAFDRLPILADALEEAGCTNADDLLHCRQPGEHVRGCWVIDLVLGKA